LSLRRARGFEATPFAYLDAAAAKAALSARDAAASPDDLRARGWTVAVHNDYRVGGRSYTFWLFTKNCIAIKGEGVSDSIALDQVRAAIGGAPLTREEAEQLYEESSMSDDGTPKLPVMALKSIDAWGVSEDGQDALIQATTATQRVQLHVTFPLLVDLLTVAQAAKKKATANAANAGAELAAATLAGKYVVGHAQGTKGVLLILNHETDIETIYAFSSEDAIAAGKMLMAEGARRRNIERAVAGGVRKVLTPDGEPATRGKLILPGNGSKN
jgi:hypothetical protein